MLWRPPARVWEPAAAPGPVLSVAEFKARVRVDHPDEDALLADLLAAAVDHVEKHTGRLLAARSCVLRLPGLPPPGSCIEIPGGVVQSVTSLVIGTDAGNQTVSSALYAAQGHSPARLVALSDEPWPQPAAFGLPVTLTYVAGYPASGSPVDYGASVPAALISAVAMIAAELYEQRRDSIVGASVQKAPLGAQALMAAWRIAALG